MLYIAPLKLNDLSFLGEEFIIYMECYVINATMHTVQHTSIKYSHHIVRIKILHQKKKKSPFSSVNKLYLKF